MLLVITGSGDFTADYIFEKFGNKAFRFNYDLFFDYEFRFSPNGWTIRNPAGHSISNETASRCFWWKPFNFFLEQEEYVVGEVKYIFREIYNWFAVRNMTVGNSGLYHQLMGKMNILGVAAKHMRIPESVLLWGGAVYGNIGMGKVVAKSLSSGLTTSNMALYTTEVDPRRLDLKYPWFLQEKIEAEFDITVQYVGEKLFAFARSRKNLKTLDWRQDIFTRDMDLVPWEIVELPDRVVGSLRSFASDLKIDWGRVDLIGDLNDPIFLEFNANGQWLFLDPHEENGLASEVLKYLIG